MRLFGVYTATRMNDERVFCIWTQNEETGSIASLPAELFKRLEELGKVEEQKFHIRRARLAEAFLELADGDVLFSEPLDYWRRLFLWSKRLAEQGKFHPGLIEREKLFYSRWIVDWSDGELLDAWEEWLQEGVERALDGRRLKAFVEDCVDSYVRFVINTRVSVKRSQLGKLLTFKPFYVHEDWMQRLCMEVDEPGAGKRWEELYEAYKKWMGRVVREDRANGRLCFRLEPTTESSKWLIRYYWMEPSGNLLDWTRMGDFRSQFLRSLANALNRYPLLRETPSSLPFHSEINAEQAYQFLKETAPALRKEGSLAFVPRSLLRPKSLPYRLNVVLDSGEERSELGLNSLLTFDFQLSLGDQEVSLEELERWSETTAPLLRANGEWVVLDQERLKRSIQWLKTIRKRRRLSLREAFHLRALNGDRELLPLSIDQWRVRGWVDDWMRSMEKTERTRLYPIPSLFKGELRPYQRAGMSWLIQMRKWKMGACLADDMGLGKTVQLIAYVARCKEREPLKRPFLIICPASLLANWQKEIERFAPSLSVMFHHGSDRLTDDGFIEAASKTDVVLTTYALARRDGAFISLVHWEGVVLDEAQHIKNASSLQARAIRGFPAKHRIALTGTPMENRLDELWSIFDFLNPGFLGSRASFQRQFSVPIEKYGDRERMLSLKKLIRPFLLRRSKDDPTVIRDLPDKIETKEYCPLTARQAMLYQKIVNELFDKERSASGFARKGLILSAILKLKQICDHPSLVLPNAGEERSGKMVRLMEIVEEALKGDESVLIFTQFRKMGGLLQQQLKERFAISAPFLHGGLAARQRERLIEQFQEENISPVFILSLKAGGVGLNLTRASRVIHFDRWWNPAVENQATDRAFRIGQTKTVHVHKLISAGTIEEKIDQMIERKTDLTTNIIGSGENWITELDSDDLRELLTLRRQLIESDEDKEGEA